VSKNKEIKNLIKYIDEQQTSLRQILEALPNETRLTLARRRSPHLATGPFSIWPCTDGVLVAIENGFTQETKSIEHRFSKKSVLDLFNEKSSDFFKFYEPISKAVHQGHIVSLSQSDSFANSNQTFRIEDEESSTFLPKYSKVFIIGWNYLANNQALDSRQRVVEDLQFALTDRNVKDLQNANKLLSTFENLLDSATREEEVQQFLKSHPEFLYPEYEECIPKPSLGGKFQLDFAIAIRHLGGLQWIFIEIERPDKSIFTSGSDFRFHSDFTQAENQLLDWDAEISRQPSFYERDFRGLFKPKYHLIYGREKELDEDRRRKIQTKFNTTSTQIFSTYDDLANRYKQITERVFKN
jgi:hypothetical protein